MSDDDWEQYAHCAESELPSELQWDLSPHSDRRCDLYFGGPPNRGEPYRWGAPFRRVVSLKTNSITHARFRRVAHDSRKTEEIE